MLAIGALGIIALLTVLVLLAGLSGFGRSVVLRANRLGMMIDVSHASDACVGDVLQVSAAPVIASHSAAHALVPHPRNINDGLLRGIADSGGVVQVVAYTYFLKSDPALDLPDLQFFASPATVDFEGLAKNGTMTVENTSMRRADRLGRAASDGIARRSTKNIAT